MRFIARCYKNIGKNTEALEWATKATLEWPWARESWLELARCANVAKDWTTVYFAITKCLAIKERGMSYISDSACWGSEPYDLGALAAYYSGLHKQAIDLGRQAVNINPSDQRLKKNLEFYLETQE
jgi:tetratricopeptide (TPR) repeat protein